jgi:hypothetical protein
MVLEPCYLILYVRWTADNQELQQPSKLIQKITKTHSPQIRKATIRGGRRILIRGQLSNYNDLSSLNSLINQILNKKINNLMYILTSLKIY